MAKKAHVAPDGFVTVILVDGNRNHPTEVDVPKDVNGLHPPFRIAVAGVPYDHVEDDAEGRWIYAPTR